MGLHVVFRAALIDFANAETFPAAVHVAMRRDAYSSDSTSAKERYVLVAQEREICCDGSVGERIAYGMAAS